MDEAREEVREKRRGGSVSLAAGSIVAEASGRKKGCDQRCKDKQKGGRGRRNEDFRQDTGLKCC